MNVIKEARDRYKINRNIHIVSMRKKTVKYYIKKKLSENIMNLSRAIPCHPRPRLRRVKALAESHLMMLDSLRSIAEDLGRRWLPP